MFKLFTCVLLLAFSFTKSAAQVDSAQLSITENKILDTICNCFSKIDSNTVNNISDLQQAFSKCFALGTQGLKLYFVQSGIDTTTLAPEEGNRIANYFALEIVKTCTYLTILS